MPSVFVYSAGQTAATHFERSIRDGIPITTFRALIPDHVYASLEQAYPDGVSHLWGDRGGDHGRMYWQQIRPGDLALCYRQRSIVAVSTVLLTLENEAAGVAAWPDASDEPYRLLFFLTKPMWTSKPVASLPQYFGKVYQGLRRLPSSDRILSDFGSMDRFVREALLSDAAHDAHTASSPVVTIARSGNPSVATSEDETSSNSDAETVAQVGPEKRNPPWSRDELILALDLYFRVDLSKVASSDPAVVALSDLLNRLRLHDSSRRNALYRNPNGVRMKLMNFLRFDPDYTGQGLARGGRLEKQIWDEFASDKTALAKAAQLIAEAVEYLEDEQHKQPIDDGDTFVEGGVLEVIHRRRERSRKLVARKKMSALSENGCLQCEVCGFDFAQGYGELGRGFIECHHRSPLSEVTQARENRLSDLAVVCANCHRMLHRRRPWLTVEELISTIGEVRPQTGFANRT